MMRVRIANKTICVVIVSLAGFAPWGRIALAADDDHTLDVVGCCIGGKASATATVMANPADDVHLTWYIYDIQHGVVLPPRFTADQRITLNINDIYPSYMTPTPTESVNSTSASFWVESQGNRYEHEDGDIGGCRFKPGIRIDEVNFTRDANVATRLTLSYNVTSKHFDADVWVGCHGTYRVDNKKKPINAKLMPKQRIKQGKPIVMKDVAVELPNDVTYPLRLTVLAWAPKDDSYDYTRVVFKAP